MASKKNKSELEDIISECEQLSLYIQDESYDSIMSDFKYYYGIDECNLNSFINDLLIKMIEFTYQNRIVTDEDLRLFEVKKKKYGTGKVMRLRLKSESRNALYKAESNSRTIIKDDKRSSIADLLVAEHGSIYTVDPSYVSLIKKYFDHLLDYYGSLPTHIREGIFFREKYNVINDSIKRHKIISINADGNEFDMRPFLLSSDSSVKYLYLSGYVDKTIRSFRFSRITILDNDYDDNSGELTAKEKEMIKERIIQSGIAYLSERIIDGIEVLLSENGYYMYSEVIIHQRPKLKNDTIYEQSEEAIAYYQKLTGIRYTKQIHCCCTARQARYYFTRFGQDALIVDPVDLAKECRDFYNNAAKAYNSLTSSASKKDADDQ